MSKWTERLFEGKYKPLEILARTLKEDISLVRRENTDTDVLKELHGMANDLFGLINRRRKSQDRATRPSSTDIETAIANIKSSVKDIESGPLKEAKGMGFVFESTRLIDNELNLVRGELKSGDSSNIAHRVFTGTYKPLQSIADKLRKTAKTAFGQEFCPEMTETQRQEFKAIARDSEYLHNSIDNYRKAAGNLSESYQYISDCTQTINESIGILEKEQLPAEAANLLKLLKHTKSAFDNEFTARHYCFVMDLKDSAPSTPSIAR